MGLTDKRQTFFCQASSMVSLSLWSGQKHHNNYWIDCMLDRLPCNLVKIFIIQIFVLDSRAKLLEKSGHCQMWIDQFHLINFLVDPRVVCFSCLSLRCAITSSSQCYDMSR